MRRRKAPSDRSLDPVAKKLKLDTDVTMDENQEDNQAAAALPVSEETPFVVHVSE